MTNFKVLVNKRIEENVFTSEYQCKYCDDFVTHLIQLPDNSINICKGCLNKMIIKLNKTRVDTFQSDFEEARKESIC